MINKAVPVYINKKGSKDIRKVFTIFLLAFLFISMSSLSTLTVRAGSLEENTTQQLDQSFKLNDRVK